MTTFTLVSVDKADFLDKKIYCFQSFDNGVVNFIVEEIEDDELKVTIGAANVDLATYAKLEADFETALRYTQFHRELHVGFKLEA